MKNLLDDSAGVVKAAILRALYEMRVEEARIKEIIDRLRGKEP
jgi:hypothetical protein